jgi:hypothetical protein
VRKPYLIPQQLVFMLTSTRNYSNDC